MCASVSKHVCSKPPKGICKSHGSATRVAAHIRVIWFSVVHNAAKFGSLV